VSKWENLYRQLLEVEAARQSNGGLWRQLLFWKAR